MRLHHHSANSLINRLVPSRQIENCLTKFLYLRRAIKNTKTVDPSHHCTSSQKLWSAVCLMLLKDQVYRLSAAANTVSVMARRSCVTQLIEVFDFIGH